MNRSKRFQTEKRSREREALLQSGLTPEAADAELRRRDNQEAAIAWLHGQLFPEEYDLMYDDVSDAARRQRGENPMREEYVRLVDAKREALKMPPLAANGCARGNATRLYCEQLVGKLGEILSGHKQSEVPLAPCPSGK